MRKKYETKLLCYAKRVFSMKYAGALLLVLIPLYSILYTPYPTFAASPSPTASASANPLKQKIEALKQEIASKAANLKAEIKEKLQNKAYFGPIIEVKDNSITITLKKNPKVVLVNEYTEYQDQSKLKKKQLTLKSLSPDDYIVALGDVDDKNNLTAKKIIKIDPLKQSSHRAVWGQIQSSQNPTITIKLKDGKTQSISIDEETQIFLGDKEASFVDIKVNKYLVASGKMDGNTLEASYIYLIPTTGFTLPQNVKPSTPASPSASPKK
jgi:hypothetical protein